MHVCMYACMYLFTFLFLRQSYVSQSLIPYIAKELLTLPRTISRVLPNFWLTYHFLTVSLLLPFSANETCPYEATNLLLSNKLLLGSQD